MIIYKCCFTGKDVFSDAYNVKLVDDLYYVVEGKFVKQDVGIDDSLIGGNKSAEAEDEGCEDSVLLNSNLLSSAKLEEIPTITSKDDFKKAIKAYANKLIAHIAETDKERADFLKSKLNDVVKPMITNFKKTRFYATEGDEFDCEGIIIPFVQDCEYGEECEDTKCRITVFKDALTIEKY